MELMCKRKCGAAVCRSAPLRTSERELLALAHGDDGVVGVRAGKGRWLLQQL